MFNRSFVLSMVSCAAWIALVGAAPSIPATSFQSASVERLRNGMTIVSQPTGGALVAVEVVVPVGLAQQTSANAGIADVTAALVLRTHVDGGASLAFRATSERNLSRESPAHTANPAPTSPPTRRETPKSSLR